MTTEGIHGDLTRMTVTYSPSVFYRPDRIITTELQDISENRAGYGNTFVRLFGDTWDYEFPVDGDAPARLAAEDEGKGNPWAPDLWDETYCNACLEYLEDCICDRMCNECHDLVSECVCVGEVPC